ncbi:MAG: energy transducer TonB [Bacteroidota bacterium]
MLTFLCSLTLQLIYFPAYSQQDEDVVDIPMKDTPPEIEKGDYPDMNTIILVDKEPIPLNMNLVKGMIGYPKKARRKDIEGSVVIRALMDEEGEYVTHFVLLEGHPILREAVERGIKYLKCEPAIQDGVPIKFWINIPFNFALQDPPRKKRSFW